MNAETTKWPAEDGGAIEFCPCQTCRAEAERRMKKTRSQTCGEQRGEIAIKQSNARFIIRSVQRQTPDNPAH